MFFLPREISPGSSLADSTAVVGSLNRATVDGRLAVKNLDVHLPNRSRIALRVDTTLMGTVSEPEIKGEVEILSGYFRIPEISRSLLPVEGESLLWQAMASAEGSPDSMSTSGPPVDPDVHGPVLGETGGS